MMQIFHKKNIGKICKQYFDARESRYDRARMEYHLGQLEGGETPTTSVQKLRQRWAGCKVQVGGIRIGGSLVSRSCALYLAVLSVQTALYLVQTALFCKTGVWSQTAALHVLPCSLQLKCMFVPVYISKQNCKVVKVFF